jgi:hypothetical protein
MLLYYRLMTKWSGLGGSTELSRVGLSQNYGDMNKPIPRKEQDVCKARYNSSISLKNSRYSSSISETHVVHLRLHYLDELRRVYFMRVSAHIGFVTGIKQRQLPQLVTGHVKWLFLWAHRELW